MYQERDSLEPTFSYRLVTTVLLFGLLLEWLLPWVHAGEWSRLLQPQALLWLTGIMLALGMLRPSMGVFIAVGLFTGLMALMFIYRGADQSVVQWFAQLIPSFSENVRDMFHYGIWYMSDECRTILLFTGWLLLVPSLQSMVWYYQLSLSLVAATLLYLVTLHTTLGINVWYGLLRTMAEGLLLVALTTLPKLQRRLQLSASWGRQARYQYASIVLLVVIVVAGGMVLSNNKEKRSEPVAWSNLFSFSISEELTVWTQQSSGLPLRNVTSSSYRQSSLATTGYGDDDQVLGQTIRPSSEVVFYGWSAQENYWRAETRSTYTGQGWSDEGGAVALHTISDEQAASAELGTGANRMRLQQSITYVEPRVGMPLMQSGTRGVVLELIASDPERKLSNYITEPATGALYSPVKDAAIKSYTVLTELPIVVPDELNDMVEPDEELAQRAWESDMLHSYLQLPEQLPERVAALASEVSGGGWTSRYDQVLAIEQYLKDNYTYSLKSEIPNEHEDFVDHFLFEQQSGYCVHFATAMVVLLRTQDIPARYVKGYHMGEAVEQRTIEGGIVETQYKVRNNDAHAWVEVYFPTVGWVAFDPTPAVEEAEQTTGWMSQMGQLGSELWTELKQWTSALSPDQWMLAGAVSVAVLAIVIMLRLVWSRLQVARMLRRYRQWYARLMEVEKLREAPISYPSRNKKRLEQQQRAMEQLPEIREQIQFNVQRLVKHRLKCLEHAVSEHANPATWRQCIKVIMAGIHDQGQKQALEELLQMLERLYYSKQMTAPEPGELQLMLDALMLKRARVNKKASTDQPNSREYAVGGALEQEGTIAAGPGAR